MTAINLSDEDIGTLQAAVENLRSCERPQRVVEAAFLIAFRLEQLAKRADEQRRASQ